MQIALNNNKLKYIYEDRDIIDIIKEDLSEELAEIVEKKITEDSEESQRIELEFNSDFRAYERENESFRFSLQDISETVESMQEYLKDAKKLDRDKMFKWLLDIKTEINNCI